MLANFGFAVIFFLEMILKMAALGVRGYLSNSFNIFDCVVVLFSLVEIALSPPAAPLPSARSSPSSACGSPPSSS